MNDNVHVWEEDILLPTYGTGLPEKNPVFLEKRVYQGSRGAVYPYPVIESVEDTCADRLYHAVFMENDYLKIMVLPQLGGRIQMAYDKLKQRHFIYYNRIIKPALVGLAGPWISGGIEFNWPQHHRPSTFLPVDFTIERYPDGSATVSVSELERMTHQKGMAGFTLYPGRAVLEVKGVLYNPTPLPQTFLWWANPAVAVNEHYQSVFPADVHAVFDHGKRDVSRYPVATGTYCKTDCSEGVDISRYKNIPVPTSYMAGKSKYDFIGGYENDTRAGVLHVANHHIGPGKKQCTWGNGDFGRARDENLTDADGPYIELMTGVFTDNQPDFSWIQPYEEKRFSQYFIPYRELGVVKNATADLLMNLEPADGACLLKVFATSAQPRLHIVVCSENTTYLDTVADLTPETVYTATLSFSGTGGIRVTIGNEAGLTLLSWEAEPEEIRLLPDAARPASAPEEVRSVEQLYLTGLHLEQYRHAVYCAADYYEEALRRDATNLRCNNAMGLWLIRRGRFAQAQRYLRRAVQTLTERNPNPYDGEPLYNLALAGFNKLGKPDEAVALLEKAYALDTSDARILLELDQLYKRLNRPHTERLAFLGQHYDVVLRRDDLYLEYVTLLNQTGCYEEAIRLIDERRFHPWEGGEGKVPAQYQLARIERAKRLTEEQAYEEALALVESCFVYPSGLGEGKLAGAQENDLLYYKACLLEASRRKEEAAAFFRKATRGNLRTMAALYYNDQQPAKLFYQGLAFRRTGSERKARSCFNRLVSYGEKHLYYRFQADYFAVSLPELQVWEEDADKRNRVGCYYLIGLGWLGLEDFARAARYLGEAARLDPNQEGIQIHRAMAERRLKEPLHSIQPNTTEV